MSEITAAAVVENMDTVTAFAGEQLQAAGCPMKAQMQIGIAIDEIFGNICHYAYGDGTGEATVRVETDENEARITFIDSGIPYNPLEKDDPDVTASLEERQIGGLGIYMVKKLGELHYRREGEKNILTFTKKLK